MRNESNVNYGINRMLNSECGISHSALRIPHSAFYIHLTALLATLIGVTVLIGWAFDIAVLKSISPDWVTMKANTAVCFILTGIALWLTAIPPLTLKTNSAIASRLARFCGLLVFLFGALSLAEYISGWDLGLDQWLFVEPGGAVDTSNPGRMAPEAALCFILLTVALWIICDVRKTRLTLLTSASCGLVVVALALAAIQSYFTPSLGSFGWFGLSIMAMPTALLFALLGMSVITLSWRRDVLPWSLSGRTTVALACGMVLLVFIALNSSRSQFWMKEANRQIAYNEEVLSDIESIQLELTEAQAHSRGYIITGDKGFLQAYADDIRDYHEKMAKFRQLFTGNPEQLQQLAMIESDADALQRWTQQFMDARQTGMSPVIHSQTELRGDSLLNNIHATFARIKSRQQQHIGELARQSENVARISYAGIAASTSVSLLIFLSVIFRLNFALDERRHAESAMLKLNHFLQSLVANIPLRIFWKDRDSRYLGCNAEFAKISGHLNPDELIGKTDFDMSWKSQAEQYRADDDAVMESGEPQLDYEEVRTTDDGKTFWVRTSKVPLRDENNYIIGILGVSQDITEHRLAENRLRESEQRYRFLFENMLEGYAYCKMLFEQDAPQDFIYLNVNKAFEKITGLKGVEGKKVTELIPGIRASNPELFEIYGRVALTGQPEKFETQVKELGVWFSITVYSPQKGYFVAMFDDITERRQAESRLNQQLDELRRWQDAMMGRETRILDLKHEVNDLLIRNGQPARYPSVEAGVE